MPAVGKAHEMLGLVGELEQALVQRDRDHPVPSAVHDQEQNPHSTDALVGPKLIAHQPSDRNKGNIPAAMSTVDENGASRITLATGCRLASATATPAPSECPHSTTGLDGKRDIANRYAASASCSKPSSVGLPVEPM